MRLGDLIQSADWKTEKHAPVIEIIKEDTQQVEKKVITTCYSVIEIPAMVQVSEPICVHVSVGKEISHPNTTEHHIRWIKVFFKPEGGKFVYEVASFEFSTHGESVDGANNGPVHTEPYRK